jgi:hypothetical protein
MRLRLLLPVIFMMPVASQAALVWSTSCQTVISAGNYLPFNNSVVLVLSPGISGCGVAGDSYSVFQVGTNGVSTDNINSILATGLAAATSGKQVAIYYDNSTSSCFGQIVAVGGAGSVLCP